MGAANSPHKRLRSERDDDPWRMLMVDKLQTTGRWPNCEWWLQILL